MPPTSAPLADISSKILIPIGDIAPLIGLVSALRARRREPRAVEGADLSLADCFRLMRELALSFGEETFSLSARPMLAGTAELVFSRAANSATVGDAMREIAHAYNLFHGNTYNRVEQKGRTVSYILDDEHFPYTRARDSYLHFTLECALIFVHSAICELADEDLAGAVRQVSTRRPDPASEARVAAQSKGALAFWDAPVGYGAGVYSISYDAAIAARPLSRRPRHMAPDLAVHNRIISLIEAKESGDRRREGFQAAVLRAFEDGLYDQNQIAARLGVSTATLRRRLADEGVNFRDAHKMALNEQARRKLAGLRDIGAVSEALGFSDARSFTRAFKSWNGMTPSAFLLTQGAQTGDDQPHRGLD